MKVGYRSWGILVVVAGALIVGAYSLGRQHSEDRASAAQSASAQPAANSQQQPAPNQQAGPLDPDAQMPADHPPMDDANSPAAQRPSPGQQAGSLDPDAQVPADHPPMDDANSLATRGLFSGADFVHFKVGNRNVKSMATRGEEVWIGTSGGVIRYNTARDSHTSYDNNTPGILSNGIFHVSQVGERMFVGTYGGGLSVYTPATDEWRNYNIPEGLADQFVYDVHKDRNGDLWIATWSGVNRVRDGDLDEPARWDTFTVENTGGGLPNPWVYALDEGPDGTMWFATEEGLARFRNGEWRNWQHDDGLGASYQQVEQDIEFTSDPSQASRHHAHQQEAQEQRMGNVQTAYNPNYIISLEVDEQGVVWCGTWGGGLARFDGDSWTNYTTADGIPANHVFMLYEDPAGGIWAGTNNGLAKVSSGDDFAVATAADGLFANNVFSMANAEDGTVWVGSFGGVAQIRRN